MKIEVSDQEFHTILAALRFFQIQRDREIQGDFLTLATNGHTIERLDYEGIDGLCERINTVDEHAAAREELASLEAEFDRAGGRGVELADRIDELRAEIDGDPWPDPEDDPEDEGVRPPPNWDWERFDWNDLKSMRAALAASGTNSGVLADRVDELRAEWDADTSPHGYWVGMCVLFNAPMVNEFLNAGKEDDDGK